MPRHQIASLPDGYIITRLNGKQYPMKLALSASGVPTARGFIHRIDGKPVTYSKRVYAANFIANHAGGRAPWAEVNGDDSPDEDERIERSAHYWEERKAIERDCIQMY
jgi:hypothetical protein